MQENLDEYFKDRRVVSCKYCHMKETFDVSNQNDRMALDCWDDYHSNCRKRLEEQSLVTAMNLKNKSLFLYMYKELK